MDKQILQAKRLKTPKSPLKKAGIFIQKLRTLLKRSWRQITRDFPLNFARLMSSLFVSLLYGAIYYKLGLSSSTVPDRLGLLQIAAVSTAMTTGKSKAILSLLLYLFSLLNLSCDCSVLKTHFNIYTYYSI